MAKVVKHECDFCREEMVDEITLSGPNYTDAAGSRDCDNWTFEYCAKHAKAIMLVLIGELQTDFQELAAGKLKGRIFHGERK